MISVGIFINNQLIRSISAKRLGNKTTGVCTYKTDGGLLVTHCREDGAVALAKKLLDLIDENEALRLAEAARKERGKT